MYKLQAMTTPQAARLFICTDFKTLSKIFQSIKATAPKGATFISVLKSITEADR